MAKLSTIFIELPGAVVYVYDNNSSDDASQIANQHGATVRHSGLKQGKGNVCRQMFRDIDAECYLMVDDKMPTLLGRKATLGHP
ncbi:MAG: hypothetical protein ACLTXI_04240 [Collinsella sp.]